MPKGLKVLITIPAYNEEATISILINDIKNILNDKYNYKILVIDDGSTDKTASIAKEAGAIVHSHNRNYGLAETFRTEMHFVGNSDVDIIVHIDADGQYLAQDIPKLIHKIEEGYDLVLGSRFAGQIEDMPLVKKIGNKAFSRAISKIIGTKITDAQTGFRAFKREIALLKISSTHTYTQEQIIRVAKQKYKIAEVPVYFARRRYGKSRLMQNPFEYAIKAWINVLRVYRDYEPLKFFGRIGLYLIAISFLILVYLILTLYANGIGILDEEIPTIILAVVIFLTGLQILFFGFLADTKKET